MQYIGYISPMTCVVHSNTSLTLALSVSMPLSIPVPPLHEPRTPLPVLPILAAHTSITLFPTETKKLAAHETLPLIMPIATPSQASPVTTPSRMTSVAPPSWMPPVDPPSQMPSVTKLPTVCFRTLIPDNASEDSDFTTLPLEAGSNLVWKMDVFLSHQVKQEDQVRVATHFQLLLTGQ